MADPLLPQDRVPHRGLVDLVEDNRDPFCGDPSGEAAAEGHPNALAHLFLQAPGGASEQLLAGLVDEQDGGSVRAEDLENPIEQLLEQVIQVKDRESRVGDGLDPREALLVGRAVVTGRLGHPPGNRSLASLGRIWTSGGDAA